MSGLLQAIDSVGPTLTQALAWFVVQGLVIGSVGLGVAWLLCERSANVRYLVHLAALVLMLACLPANLLLLPAPLPVAQAEAAELGRPVQQTQEQESPSDARVALAEAPGPVVADETDPQPWVFPPSGHAEWEGGGSPAQPTDLLDSGSDNLADWPPPTFDLQAGELNPPEQDAVDAGVVVAASSLDAPPPTLWQRLSPWVVGVYAAGLVVFLLRLLAALRGGRRLRRSAVPVDRKGLVWAVFEQQAERLGVSLKRLPGVGLLPEHFSATGPLLVGLFRPMILLPAAAVTQLTPAQLEAVIAHELAHLKRYDPWLLLFQRVVETLLFFHPMAWVVSRRMSAERENACDDMVLASGARPADYASALVMFLLSDEEASMSPRRAAVPATAVSSATALRRRVLRLFGEAEATPVKLTRKGMACCAALVLVGAVMAVLACRSAGPGPAASGDVEEGVAEDIEAQADEPAGLFWSMAPPREDGTLDLDRPSQDLWTLSPDNPMSFFDGQAVYAVVLTESDWHTLGPEALVAIVDAATSGNHPSNLGQLIEDETIATSLGLPGEQVYRTRVFGYCTERGTYGMIRLEEHPRLARRGPYEPDGPARFVQVRHVVEQSDRFDLSWGPSNPATSIRHDGRFAATRPGAVGGMTEHLGGYRFQARAGSTYTITCRNTHFTPEVRVVDLEENELAVGHARWRVAKPYREADRREGYIARVVWRATEDREVAVMLSCTHPAEREAPPDALRYELDIHANSEVIITEMRGAEGLPTELGVVELSGSAAMHGNTPPRFGVYHVRSRNALMPTLKSLLVGAGFDLNQLPYHRIDLVRGGALGEGVNGDEPERLTDLQVLYGAELGRGVAGDWQIALRPGDKVVVRPRELFEREEQDNLDRAALGWGLPVDGLMCRWKRGEVVIHPGQETVPLTVQVRNVSGQSIVWQAYWQLGRLSREAVHQALIEAIGAGDPGSARQGTSYSTVHGYGPNDNGIRYTYLRGGRMADEHEAEHGPRTSGSDHSLPPGGRVRYRPGVHFLPPGAVVEMTIDYPIERLTNVGGGHLGIPRELFAEVPRYNPRTSVIRSPEEGSMTGPPLAVRVLPGAADEQSGLGPLIERAMSRSQLLDLDTGDYVDPAGVEGAGMAGFWLIGPQGRPDGRVNLFDNPLSSTYGLSGRHVELVSLEGLAFDEVTAEDVAACWDDQGFAAAGREARGGLGVLTTRNGPHAFRTLAGKRGVVELIRDEDADGYGWVVRLRHLPGRQPFTQPGDPVEGVSLHLHGVRYHTARRVEQPDGTTRPAITFNLRARHDGAVPYLYPENPLIYQLEVDGRWYIYAPPVEGAGADDEASRASIYSPIDPMSQPRPYALPLSRTLGDHWYALAEDQLDKEATAPWNSGGEAVLYGPALLGDPLTLTPGEHTVRIAIGFAPDHARGIHRAVRMVSNPMQIRVPGEEREPGPEPEQVAPEDAQGAVPESPEPEQTAEFDREAWHRLVSALAQDEVTLEQAARRAVRIAASGLDPDTRDDRGFRPLPELLSPNHWWYRDTTPQERLFLARLLIEHGADPDLPGLVQNLPPLHLAADNLEPEMVRLLGELGADPNRVSLDAGEWGAPLHRVAYDIRARYRHNKTEEHLAELETQATPTIEALLAIGADPWHRADSREMDGPYSPIDLCPPGRAQDLLLDVIAQEHARLQAEVVTMVSEMLQAVLDEDADTLAHYLHANPERGHFMAHGESPAAGVIRHFRENDYLLGVDVIDPEEQFEYVYTRPDIASVLLRNEVFNGYALLVMFHDGERWGLAWTGSIPGNLNVREGMQMRTLASVAGALDHRNRPWLDAQRYKNLQKIPPLRGGGMRLNGRIEVEEMQVTASRDGGSPSIVLLRDGEAVAGIRLLGGPGDHVLVDIPGRGMTHVRQAAAHDWVITRSRIQLRGSPQSIVWDDEGELFMMAAGGDGGEPRWARQITINLRTNGSSVFDFPPRADEPPQVDREAEAEGSDLQVPPAADPSGPVGVVYTWIDHVVAGRDEEARRLTLDEVDWAIPAHFAGPREPANAEAFRQGIVPARGRVTLDLAYVIDNQAVVLSGSSGAAFYLLWKEGAWRLMSITFCNPQELLRTVNAMRGNPDVQVPTIHPAYRAHDVVAERAIWLMAPGHGAHRNLSQYLGDERLFPTDAMIVFEVQEAVREEHREDMLNRVREAGYQRLYEYVDPSRIDPLDDPGPSPFPIPEGEPVAYEAAMDALYNGEDRREAARRFRLTIGWFEERIKRRHDLAAPYRAAEAEALRMADMLEAMAEEDDAWEEPEDLDALAQDELIDYYIYHLRDVVGQPVMTPGKVNVMSGAVVGVDPETNAPAHALRNLGKPVVPALIALLDDDRPIRCISTGLNGSHVLRYRDAAEQILSAIAGQRFMPHVSRGVYFSNAPVDVQLQVVRDIERWWQASRNESEAQWLRASIEQHGIGHRTVGDDRGRRLIELEGVGCVGFFRERMAAEPSYGHVVALFWQAANSEGPPEPGIVEEVRAQLGSEHPAARLAACRALLEHGDAADVPAVIAQLRSDIEMIAGLEDWPRRGADDDFHPDTFVWMLCHAGVPESFEPACTLLEHRDPRIVNEAIYDLSRAHPPTIAPEHDPDAETPLEDAQTERLTAAFLYAMGDRADSESGPLHPGTRLMAARWVILRHDLPIELPADWNHATDEEKLAVVEQVLQWADGRPSENP
ncbi:MAG: M56 family metallopeptidase [Phycisphaerales bacterium JB063]